MVKIFLFIAFGFNCFADDNLHPILKDIEVTYSQNKLVLQDCVRRIPSRNPALGCVESFKFMKTLCSVTDESNFKKKYRFFPIAYFDGACQLSARGDNRLPAFFELDVKSCVNGFGSVSEKLLSYYKNSELIEESGEERFLYMFEKNSCKEFHKYVNFCEYVDGAYKKLLPQDNESLPKIDIGKDPKELCKPNDPHASGLYKIKYDLTALRFDQEGKIFNKLILSYRSQRSPADKSPECEQVRRTYANLECTKFESLTDGEPIWRTEDEMRNIRLNRDKKARGGSAN